jgi:multidrug resistance efflux pump
VLGKVAGAVILLAAVGLAVYVVWYLDTSPRTDDAFVRANTIGVAPQVNGRIVALRVHDNQAVKEGDVLFEIDSVPYQHSLSRAQAALDGLEKQIGLSRRDVKAQQIGALAARANIDRVRAGHPSPIIQYVCGSEARTLDTAAALLDEGILVTAIRPPTVPPGTSRLRVAISAAHTDEQLDHLAAVLRQRFPA